MAIIINATCLPFTLYKNFAAKIREMVTVHQNLTNGLIAFKGLAKQGIDSFFLTFNSLTMHKE